MLEIRREMPGRFANDLEAAHHGEPRLFVGHVGIERHALDEAEYRAAGIHEVLGKVPVIAFQGHSGTASASIR